MTTVQYGVLLGSSVYEDHIFEGRTGGLRVPSTHVSHNLRTPAEDLESFRLPGVPEAETSTRNFSPCRPSSRRIVYTAPSDALSSPHT